MCYGTFGIRLSCALVVLPHSYPTHLAQCIVSLPRLMCKPPAESMRQIRH